MFKALNTVYHASLQQRSLKDQENPTSPKGSPTRTTRSPSIGLPSPLSNMNLSLYSITVGSPEKKTLANWHVRSSLEIVGCLKELAAVSINQNNS